MMLINQTGDEATRIISARPDSVRQYANPLKMMRHLWSHRELIRHFTKREVLEQYKGSYLGLAWSFATPLAMLTVYTFVFSVIFKARFEQIRTGSYAEFALGLFAGLIVFNVFGQALTISPRLILSNANYVKKVVFPLEILPVSKLAAMIVDSLFNLIILLLGAVIILRYIPGTIIFLPLMYLPLIFLSLGLSWFLASLGVFIRDINNLLSVTVQMLFFLTPIFYPISAIPEGYRLILYLNPLTFIVNHFRRVILWGQMPDWGEYVIITGGTFVICMLGYIWFMKSKKTFADVV